MKRLVFALLLLSLSVAQAELPSVATSPPPVSLNAAGYADNGVAMAPLRPVCDFLKAQVSFHDGLITIVKTFGEPNLARTITLRLGGKSAQIWDGASRVVTLSRPAESRLGTIFLPAKFLVEILGGELEVDKTGVPKTVREGERLAIFASSDAASYKGGDAGRVTLINRVGKALSLRLNGPQKLRVEIAHGDKIYLQVKPGLYYYQAGCAGMQTINGARRLLAGRKTSWAWGKQ
jgi:hypothetical protein